MKKKYLTIFISCFVLCFICSCANKSNQNNKDSYQESDSIEYFREIIREDIKSTDVSLMSSNICTFEYMKYEDDIIKLSCNYNEHIMHYDSLIRHKEALKANYVNSLLCGTNTRKEFASSVLKGKIGFEIKISTTKTESSFNVNITPEEIQVIMSEDKNPKERAQKFIASNVAISNAQCPSKIDEYTIFLGVNYIENKVFYRYQILEDENLDFSNPEVFENAKYIMKQTIIDNFKTNNVGMKNSLRNLLEAYINSETDVTYKYIGNKSGKSFEVTLSLSEIKEILDDY